MSVRFDVVLRGYDRGEVDALVAQVGEALREGADPALRERVRRELSTVSLRIALRGYDRSQVEILVQHALARLGGPVA